MTFKSIRSGKSWHLAKSSGDVVANVVLFGFINTRSGSVVEDRDQIDIGKGNLIAKAELTSSLTD